MSYLRHLRSFCCFLSWPTILVIGICAGWASTPSVFAGPKPQPDLNEGRAAYQRSCARCHGADGAGDGVDAKRFYPRPRDLSYGTYKFRTTASGTPPTDEDIFKVLTQGLPGSNMPDWAHMDEEERWQLVYYMKSLSTIFDEVPPDPVELSEDPGPEKADLTAGRQVYEQMGCAACHGDQGRANGLSAALLTDEWEMPIRPANLTQGWNYRGGQDPVSVMMRFMTGIDGSGMPAYKGAITDEEAWNLAYYVVSLQKAPHWHRIAHAAEAARGSLPENVDDPAWESAERTDIRLRNVVTQDGEWARAPTTNLISLEMLYNDEEAALRITWTDPTEDRSASGDALALLLKPEAVKGDAVSLQTWPYQGAPGLDIYFWSAHSGQAQEGIGENFDSVRDRKVSVAPRPSAAQYHDGEWQMVIRRPLRASGVPAIEPDKLLSVAFAVWDGGNENARAVTPWFDVALKPIGPSAPNGH